MQLPLGFGLRDDATFANYLSEGNLLAFDAVSNIVKNIGDNFVYLWGSEGCGCSHLLQASCHAAPEFSQTAVYIPLAQSSNLQASIFEGLENINLVCLDDVEQVAGNPILEEQLFHFFNKVRAKGNRLLIAANVPPTQLPIKLADLKSRLTWGVVYQLHALNDEQKIKVLQDRAQARGLYLDHSLGKFLLRRCPRNMSQMFNMLDTLDQASLAEQRRLTIPFVKEVLGF